MKWKAAENRTAPASLC